MDEVEQHLERIVELRRARMGRLAELAKKSYDSQDEVDLAEIDLLLAQIALAEHKEKRSG